MLERTKRVSCETQGPPVFPKIIQVELNLGVQEFQRVAQAHFLSNQKMNEKGKGFVVACLSSWFDKEGLELSQALPTIDSFFTSYTIYNAFAHFRLVLARDGASAGFVFVLV